MEWRPASDDTVRSNDARFRDKQNLLHYKIHVRLPNTTVTSGIIHSFAFVDRPIFKTEPQTRHLGTGSVTFSYKSTKRTEPVPERRFTSYFQHRTMDEVQTANHSKYDIPPSEQYGTG